MSQEQKKEVPENNPIFNAQDMQDRSDRLKAEGRMPSLEEILKIVNAFKARQ